MVRIIGVNFRNGGKIYYFAPGERLVRVGEKVIVETSRGVDMGTVILGTRDVDESKIPTPLQNVLRIATEEDLEHAKENREKEKEAFAICQEKIVRHGLEMKLISCEYAFENNKILFYFTADGRIDFRELVKDLASVFRTRIELRQIGVRDETKMLGGIGICGRELCCKSYLADFVPVSIRMAKEQNLSLNPTKISGTCGRLMCCLKNEEETYEYLNARLPVVGEFVLHKGDNTHGKVYSVDVLRQRVKVVVSLPGDDLEIREYPVDELRFKPRQRRGDDEDDSNMTEDQQALEEELNRVKEAHAVAEAAAAAALEKNAQERSERAARRDNTALHQAVKAIRESEAAEQREREVRNARIESVKKGGEHEAKRGESAQAEGKANTDRQKKNGQNRSYAGPNPSNGNREDRQDHGYQGRYRSNDRDSFSNRDGRSSRDGYAAKENRQNKDGYHGKDGYSYRDNYQGRGGDHSTKGGYQGRDNRPYRDNNHTNAQERANVQERANAQDRTNLQERANLQERVNAQDRSFNQERGYGDRHSVRKYHDQKGGDRHYNHYDSRNRNYHGNGAGDNKYGENRDNSWKNGQDGYHSQRRKSNLRYSSRKNVSSNADRRDDDN